MKAKDLFIACFALILLGLVAYLWLTPSGAHDAPDIRLTTLDGRSITLSEMRGHPVLVTFWASTCPGCVKEMPHLADLYRELAPRGFEVIGVAMSYDPEDQVRETVRRRQVPYAVAIDKDGSVAAAFGEVTLTPTHFLIDSEGRVVQQKLGEWDMAELKGKVEQMLPAGSRGA